MLAKEVILVGVVLDLKSPVGRVAESYMSMARSDFYAVNHNYRTRLTLFAKDTEDDVITEVTQWHVGCVRCVVQSSSKLWTAREGAWGVR